MKLCNMSLLLPLFAAVLCCYGAAAETRDICSCHDTGLPCDRVPQQAVACYAGNFLVRCTATHAYISFGQDTCTHLYAGHILILMIPKRFQYYQQV